MFKCIAAMLILSFVVGCKKIVEILVPVEPEEPGITNEWANNPYKLNVVYFIPNDNDSVPDYRQRISRILLDAQSFFATNLEREGFGRKSFGLDIINDSLVNIVTIIGQKGKDSYPYTGGGAAVQPEVEAYFAANPDKKESEHYLVILPSRSGDPMNPGGVPFYGTGKFCYALDYEYLDAKYLGEQSPLGSLATKWIGGMIHELGHGLNAPHNYGTVSTVDQYGTALMGAGNSTYGKQATFITSTTAAIFANSQSFSTEVRSDWYQNFDFSLKSLRASLSNGKIILSGTFSSAQQINNVAAYFDPEPYGSNLDYDAITFLSNSLNNDRLYIESPPSHFQKLTGAYLLKLHFIAPNGLRKTESFVFSFQNNVPILDNVYKTELRDRSLWTITSSGDQPGSAITNILDGDLATNWHTPWSPVETNHPHIVSIDTKTMTTFNTLVIYNRSNLNGALKDFYLKTSDDGTNWTTVGMFSLLRNAGVNYVALGNTISTQNIRIESINSHGGFKYTHMAEFDVIIK